MRSTLRSILYTKKGNTEHCHRGQECSLDASPFGCIQGRALPKLDKTIWSVLHDNGASLLASSSLLGGARAPFLETTANY